MKLFLIIVLLGLWFAQPLIAARYSKIENSNDAIIRRGVEYGSTDPRLLTQKFGPAHQYRWVVFNRVDPSTVPFDDAAEKLIRVDTVTPTTHDVTWQVVPLAGDELTNARRLKRLENLAVDIAGIADQLRPAQAGGGGKRFDQLSPSDQTKLMRYFLLIQGFDS